MNLVRCFCRDPHREHEFTQSGYGLCAVCGHTIGAHRSIEQGNADVAERIGRMLRTYDVGDWSVHPDKDGGLLITMYLKPVPGVQRR